MHKAYQEMLLRYPGYPSYASFEKAENLKAKLSKEKTASETRSYGTRQSLKRSLPQSSQQIPKRSKPNVDNEVNNDEDSDDIPLAHIVSQNRQNIDHEQFQLLDDKQAEEHDTLAIDKKDESGSDEDKPNKCSHQGCNSRFKRKYHLKQHIERVHTAQVSKYVCPVNGCGVLVGEIPMLRIHCARFHGEMKWIIQKKGTSFFFNDTEIMQTRVSKNKLVNGRLYEKHSMVLKNEGGSDDGANETVAKQPLGENAKSKQSVTGRNDFFQI